MVKRFVCRREENKSRKNVGNELRVYRTGWLSFCLCFLPLAALLGMKLVAQLDPEMGTLGFGEGRELVR